MLAKCVLASPASGHRLRWRKILKLVKSRLKRWEDGDCLGLWTEAVESSQAQASRRKHPTNLRKQNALHATQNGQYRKAMKALGAAPADETDMLSKHPQVPSPGIPTGPTPITNQIDRVNCLERSQVIPPRVPPVSALATSVRRIGCSSL